MENKELKENMKELLRQMDQMEDSLGEKNEEIELFEGELEKLESDKQQYEVQNMFGTGFDVPEELTTEIEKTERQIEELYKEQEKENEKKREEIEKIRKPREEIRGTLEEIELFEGELEKLKMDKQQYEVQNMFGTGFDVPEELTTEIEKTEKQIEELYKELKKYSDLKIEPIKLNEVKKNEATVEQEVIEPETIETEVIEEPKIIESEIIEPEVIETEIKEPKQDEKGENNEKIVLGLDDFLKAKEQEKEEQNKVAREMKKEQEEPKETALDKPSRFKRIMQKIKDYGKNITKKIGKVWLAVSLAIVGSPDTSHVEQSEKKVINTISTYQKTKQNVPITEYKLGDKITIDNNLEYFHTSEKGNLSGMTQDWYSSKEVDAIINYLAKVDKKGNFMEMINDNTKTIGELQVECKNGERIVIHLADDKEGNINSRLGGLDKGSDLGWTEEIKDGKKEVLQEMQRQIMRRVKTNEFVKGLKVDINKPNEIEQPVIEEPKTAEPPRVKTPEDVMKEYKENGNITQKEDGTIEVDFDDEEQEL